MLISAIPPTFPWLMTGLTAGPFLSPMACRFNVQPSRLVAWLSVCLRHGCFSKYTEARFFPMMHLCVMCGCWSVNCLYLMFSLHFLKETKGQIHYVLITHLLLFILQRRTVTQSKLAIFLLSLFVILSDNQTAFQYTLPQIIISHQTSLSNAILRILHRNEICPLSMNLPPSHPWLHPPPIRVRTHRKLLLASSVNQTASWKRINFPRCTFSL